MCRVTGILGTRGIPCIAWTASVGLHVVLPFSDGRPQLYEIFCRLTILIARFEFRAVLCELICLHPLVHSDSTAIGSVCCIYFELTAIMRDII